MTIEEAIQITRMKALLHSKDERTLSMVEENELLLFGLRCEKRKSRALSEPQIGIHHDHYRLSQFISLSSSISLQFTHTIFDNSHVIQ
ncbi:hypothetical protein H5410_001921 [Solanum commersonii]|uniref:Uncharacterized protein n=1 Tax=Solanum commersonii TaxID=4109 RepID=A0A9J6B0K7_SOLCO|nr:hypothetical protein H5410_001921 [Solanum commersonii]